MQKKRNLDREKSEHKTIVDERIRRGYPVRPGEGSCKSYRLTGLCDDGSNCIFDHPRCKFFLRGACKEGTACKFIHEKNNEDSRLPMRQSSRRHHETVWKEENETRDWVIDIEKKYNRSLIQICDGIVAGYKRDQMEKEQRHGQDGQQEHRQRENTKGQRKEAKESVKEHRQREKNTKGQRRETQKHVWEQRQRENSKGQRRDAKESVKEHRQREKNTKGKRDFEKEKSKAQEDAQEQRLMGIAENHKVDAHGQDNLQVERQIKSIEWQTRREAQEMERRKPKAFLEEQRVRDKLDKKRQRDVDKLEVEDDKSSEGQRLKAKAIPDSKGVERFKDISQTHDEIMGGYKRARKMVKKFEESDQRLKEKKHAHDQPNKEASFET